MASEYGWGKKQILEQTYFDEYVDLVMLIRQTQNNHYMKLVAIASYPTMEKEEDKKGVLEMFADVYHKISFDEEDIALDKSSFDNAKLLMAENPKIIIK